MGRSEPGARPLQPACIDGSATFCVETQEGYLQRSRVVHLAAGALHTPRWPSRAKTQGACAAASRACRFVPLRGREAGLTVAGVRQWWADTVARAASAQQQEGRHCGPVSQLQAYANLTYSSVGSAVKEPLSVLVSSTEPRQGETVSVFVRPVDGNPLLRLDLKLRALLSEKLRFHTLDVRCGARRVPLLPMEGGKWRALLPTTPLDSPGDFELQIVMHGPWPRVLYCTDMTLRGKEFGVESIWLPEGKEDTQESSSLEDEEVGLGLAGPTRVGAVLRGLRAWLSGWVPADDEAVRDYVAPTAVERPVHPAEPRADNVTVRHPTVLQRSVGAELLPPWPRLRRGEGNAGCGAG